MKNYLNAKNLLYSMRKEVGIYLSVALFIGIALFSLYFFNLGFTGFVVFDESVSGFKGIPENVVYNGSAFVLSSDQTSGTYTSEIFDANTSMEWNTLVWQGGIPSAITNPLSSASHAGSLVTQLASPDGSFYSANLSQAALYINFTDALIDGSTLEVRARATTSENLEVQDLSGNVLGSFVVNSSAGEDTSVPLTLPQSTDSLAIMGDGDSVVDFDHVSSENPVQADLIFQVRSCSSPDCANVSFADVDLNDISLVGQYFQYMISFSSSDSGLSPFLENVVINSSFGIVSINISQPTGEKSSQTGIPIQFTATGIDLTCWYNVDGGENITLEGCVDSSFDVLDDDSYVFNLYVNNSLGVSDYQSSAFSVDTPAPSSLGEETSSEGITGEATTQFVETVKLTAQTIPGLTMNPNETRELTWTVKNVWSGSLQECNFESIGKFYSWINHTEIRTLDSGEEHGFVFDIIVPEETELGEYNLGVSLKCPGTGKSGLFIVDVVEKTLGFELIGVQRVSEDEVEVVYSLEELSGSEQNIELRFLLIDSTDKTISEVEETKTLLADSEEEFETLIPINVSLISLGENESLEDSELNLLINLDSEVYSFSVRERIVLGAPIGGFAIFGEGGFINAGSVIILVVFVLFLVGVFLVARQLRKGLSFSELFKNLPFRKSSQ